jgi:hypothetical protein
VAAVRLAASGWYASAAAAFTQRYAAPTAQHHQRAEFDAVHRGDLSLGRTLKQQRGMRANMSSVIRDVDLFIAAAPSCCTRPAVTGACEPVVLLQVKGLFDIASSTCQRKIIRSTASSASLIMVSFRVSICLLLWMSVAVVIRLMRTCSSWL